MTTTDTRAHLDRAAVHIRAAQLAATMATAFVEFDAGRAETFTREATEESRRALVIVCSDLGANMPPIQPGGEAGKEKSGLDLSALATLDTPDARELLALLEQAQAVAERVDAARGNVLPAHIALQPGESRGTGHAESISMIALAVRGEVFGAKPGRE